MVSFFFQDQLLEQRFDRVTHGPLLRCITGDYRVTSAPAAQAWPQGRASFDLNGSPEWEACIEIQGAAANVSL